MDPSETVVGAGDRAHRRAIIPAPTSWTPTSACWAMRWQATPRSSRARTTSRRRGASSTRCSPPPRRCIRTSRASGARRGREHRAAGRLGRSGDHRVVGDLSAAPATAADRGRVDADADAVAAEAAEFIAARRRAAAIAARGRFKLAVSGGRTPWRCCARSPPATSPWTERAPVPGGRARGAARRPRPQPHAHPREPAGAACRCPPANVHAMPVEATDLDAAAARYAQHAGDHRGHAAGARPRAPRARARRPHRLARARRSGARRGASRRRADRSRTRASGG